MESNPLMDRAAIRRLPRGRDGGTGFKRRSVAWGVALGVLLAAGIAQSAQVVEMRVGKHRDFTRVVFELDSPAGYSLGRNEPAPGVFELVITLDAGAETEKVAVKQGLIEGVNLVGGNDVSTAHIRLGSKGLRVKEMILRSPPRIVLDVMAPKVAKAAPTPTPAARPEVKVPETKLPAAGVPETKAEKQPTPEPEPKTAPTPKATVVSKSLSARPEPKSATPSAVAGTTPEPTLPSAPTPATSASRTPTTLPESPVTAVDGARVAPSAIDQAAIAKPDLNDATPPIAATAASASRSQRSPRAAAPTTPPPPARERSAARPPRAPAKSAAMPEPSGGMFADMKLVAAGVGLLVLVGVGLFVMKRRRAGAVTLDELDDDPFAADNPFAQLGDDVMDGAAASAVSADEMPVFGQSSGGSAAVVSDDDSPIAKGAAPAGGRKNLVDTAVVNDMDGATTHTNMEQRGLNPSAAVGDDMEGFNDATSVTRGMDSVAPMAGMDMGGENKEMGRMMQEFERRMSAMESRLDEVSEAKERLERQVAAQTEELRVQRAAIARTQRALRNLHRPDDESPTEPALRDPSGPNEGS